MNILFITHYYAPESGAAANRLTRLAVQLAERGHTITVLTTQPHYPAGQVPDAYRGRWTTIERRQGVRVIHVWGFTSRSEKISWRLLSQLVFMMTFALRGLVVQKPDVIFIENQPIFTGLAGWLISRVKRTPYLLNISDYWPEYLYVSGTVAQDSLIYRLFERLTNLTQQSAAHLVIMWAGLQQSIDNRLSAPPPTTLIYSAVDLAQYAAASGARFRQMHKLGDERLVTFLGGLGPHIDLDTMLATAAALRDDEVTVLFVGAGAQKEALVTALEQPQMAHCRYIDWIDAADVPDFWAASHLTYWALCDNPLDKLRFQAKLYEALASGTPPVIAVEGTMSDFLDETQTGITVPHSAADALTAAIRRLLHDDAAYQAMRQRAQQYAQENFDLERQVDAYERLLQQIAAV